MVFDNQWSYKISANIQDDEQDCRENIILFLRFELDCLEKKNHTYTSAALNKKKTPTVYYTEMNGWLYLCMHL